MQKCEGIDKAHELFDRMPQEMNYHGTEQLQDVHIMDY